MVDPENLQQGAALGGTYVLDERLVSHTAAGTLWRAHCLGGPAQILVRLIPCASTGEALRVPLFLIWSRIPRHLAVRRMSAVYARAVQPGVGVPTVIEPVSGTVLESSPDAGYQALAGLVGCAQENGLGAQIPPFTSNQPYYPATLHLFAMIAAYETLPECVPL